jgi:hypothetical protein
MGRTTNDNLNPEREPKLLTKADVRKKNIRSGDTVLMWVYKYSLDPKWPWADDTKIEPTIYKVLSVRAHCSEYTIIFEEMASSGYSIASLLRHMKID